MQLGADTDKADGVGEREHAGQERGGVLTETVADEAVRKGPEGHVLAG